MSDSSRRTSDHFYGLSKPEPTFGISSLACCDDDFVQLTKLRSAPHGCLSKIFHGKGKSLISPVKMLMGREFNCNGKGRFSLSDSSHVSSRYLPFHSPSVIARERSEAYISQFSADGSLFVAGYEDGHIKIYDVDLGWKNRKTIKCRGWTLCPTDACLSPDQCYLVYSRNSLVAHIASTTSASTDSHAEVMDIHERLDFRSSSALPSVNYGYGYGIFSVKFSADGRELLAASSNKSVYVYDVEARKTSLSVRGHTDDVNAICYADDSGQIFYSGSDDHLCKVWDKRCLVNGHAAVGVLTGHLEGITFIDAHRDSHYFISNGKDQTTKLWDIRKMSYKDQYPSRVRYLCWDYRLLDRAALLPRSRHPEDRSLATYIGHSVTKTLIRSYFSPAHSTGQRYIYTGSSDSSVYVYDVVSADRLAKLDFHTQPVRDCSWHPFLPMIVSSSFDGEIVKWECPTNRRRRHM